MVILPLLVFLLGLFGRRNNYLSNLKSASLQINSRFDRFDYDFPGYSLCWLKCKNLQGLSRIEWLVGVASSLYSNLYKAFCEPIDMT